MDAAAPQDRVGSENCTTHTINVVPIVGRHIIASSGYQYGVNVIDVTNPRRPGGSRTSTRSRRRPATAASGCWTGYWCNDNLWSRTELDWGTHAFTLSDPWWKQALNMNELNPQTFTKLIRCNAKVGPQDAGRQEDPHHGQGEPVRAGA